MPIAKPYRLINGEGVRFADIITEGNTTIISYSPFLNWVGVIPSYLLNSLQK